MPLIKVVALFEDLYYYLCYPYWCCSNLGSSMECMSQENIKNPKIGWIEQNCQLNLIILMH